VLDAVADLLEAILTRSDTVRILATSREGLQVTDEQLRPIPPLDANTSGATLFVERASSVAPNMSLSEANEPVVEICKRLDGIPLAIELAASRMQSMTVTEIRDRLDDRFRLLVGSRRGLARHQTLRHAVQWSYDLITDAEKRLLARCSVFTGGFDLVAASAVADIHDEYAAINLLDGLVRKSLVVADRSSARTRFTMLETIRQFAEEQLVDGGAADEVRASHARYFAGREADVMNVWNSPRQREANDWFSLEHANLRTAFRWAIDHEDLDTAAAIAVYATFLGYVMEQIEPVSWAEELIPRARAAHHRRLAQLYVAAALCVVSGRIDEFLGYASAAASAIESGLFDEVPEEFEFTTGSGYLTAAMPERCIEWCRRLIARRPRSHPYTQTCLVLGLSFAGDDGAAAASEELLIIAEGARNPNLASFALLGYGWAQRESNPTAAHGALRRALMIARDSGNRQTESSTALILSRLAVTHVDTTDALDSLALTVRHYSDSGSVRYLAGPIAVLAALLDRLSLPEPAATMSGFATNGVAHVAFPELSEAIIHLRGLLGDEGYEARARVGATMTSAQIATFTFEQIELARAQIR
jgi:predicted ATPase